MYADLSESQFRAVVVEMASLRGWRAFFVENSTREIVRASGARVRVRNINLGGRGFPDLVLVRERILYRELKREHDTHTPAEQHEWGAAIARAGGDFAIWRPRDWQKIEEELR